MKVRADFVTNSSSSGFVLVSINMKNGDEIQVRREYDSGFGGYFWRGFEEQYLNSSFDEATEGKEILDILRDCIDEFDSFLLDGAAGIACEEFQDTLLKLDSLLEVNSITIEEETHYDTGGMNEQRYEYTFHLHNNKTFYPEDWTEYYDSLDNQFDRLSRIKEEETWSDLPTLIADEKERLCVYFLTWLDSDVCGFTEQEAEFMRSLAGSGHFAELLRLHFFVWMMLTTNPAKFEDLANVCFEVIVHEDVAEKARDYLKYVIEHIPESRKPFTKAYNAILEDAHSDLPKLNDQEIDAFIAGSEGKHLNGQEPEKTRIQETTQVVDTFPNGKRIYPGDDLSIHFGTVEHYYGSERDIILPSDIDEIGDEAFRFTSIRSIVIPEGVTRIGRDAFYCCTELKYVSLPASLSSIGESAFYGCSNLKKLELPKSVETIGDHAFAKSGVQYL